MNDHPGGRDKLKWIVAGVALIVFFSNFGDLGVAFALPVMALLIVGATIVLRGPLGRALAHRLERGPDGAGYDPALTEEVLDLRARVGELEERLDFAERLLASAREANRIEGV